MSKAQFRVGFVLNPVAGVGAGVALKGSDGADLQAEAQRRGGQPRGQPRARDFFQQLLAAGLGQTISWHSWQGLGAELLQDIGTEPEVLGQAAMPTSATDTQACVGAFADAGVDLILFVGGDGTAVDILQALTEQSLPEQPLVLGIPAGVKMHSGVFAVSPQAAAEVFKRLLQGDLVAASEAEVVDYAAPAASGDAIRTRSFGYLRVPQVAGFIQHTKEGGRESEPLALAEISADIVEQVQSDDVVLLGPGGTLYAVKQALGLTTPTLRGFDLRLADGQWQLDVQAPQLEKIPEKSPDNINVFLSFTRQQGFLLGRGNMELSARFLAALPRQRLQVVATRSKILSLEGRPLLVDCGVPAVDDKFSGLIEVIAGYEDRLVYRVQSASAPETHADP